MNERIKELAEQAEMAANKGDHVDVKIMMAKFAELIVEECRTVLADVYRETPLECCGHFLHADEVLAKHFYGG